ncbi:TetR/AcrR family transcriptional regulator [Blastococcus xanthinilyticus]|uniref:TetR/AcrR family transcriptional regulator n=1 Tax=Blastococcus xanthinilyticus TaxID=1564164 RepID=UPI001FB84E12|nr:helix-turn-helix domain-containing protein [Blastococcus xanthinilyticus]
MTSAGTAGSGRSAGAQRVLDAALELFSEHGFEGTSLQDIADRLGVTKAAVYYHFHTKDELLLALVEPAFDELLALADSGLQARRRGGLDVAGYVDYLLRHRRVAAYLTRDPTAMSRPGLVEKGTRMREQVEAMLLGGDGDDLGNLWGAATLQALAGALLAAPPDASEEWLREELTELGAHLRAGYRKAARRRGGSGTVQPQTGMKPDR